MAGDYTRFTFKPQRRYSGVLMQQGRVQLDADWNEQAELLDRRLRIQAEDTYGPAWVPKETTPGAFKLTAQAGPPVDFTIGVGRMYVDGLLAEVFEGESPTYRVQRFYPAPPALPTSGAAIAFLDVWEREVTYIEDSALLEIALGGPDTTTRRQVVWQVKIQAVDAPTCDTDLDALFPPSAGQLSTQAIAPPPSNLPCILSPAGGYRGLENRLYRVEVHTGGGFGTAHFKWSRDNASVVSSVLDMSSSGTQTTLRVSRIGRDKVLRFSAGDWVEITDDHRELMGEPGEIAQIAVPPDEAALTITLDRVIPASGTRPFGANADEIRARHTRIKRWDQTVSNSVDTSTGVSQVNAASGLIPVTATTLELEEGVRVTFGLSQAGGQFKVGDYWVFHARTADGSVDILTSEPPRGIQHHYAPLAVITDLSGATQPEDCRELRPECCGGCCTVSVEPGQSIQAAIDSLPEDGGCVCLKTGVHRINQTIVIGRSNIVLRGETPGVQVLAEGLPIVLQIGGEQIAIVRDVLVESIRFELAGVAEESVIALLQGCQRVRVRECGMHYTGSSLAMVVGVGVFRAENVELVSNLIERCYFGVYTGGLVHGLRVSTNILRGLTYQLSDLVEIPIALWGVVVSPQCDVQCRNNTVEDFLTAFNIMSGAQETIIADNEIRRRGLPESVGTPEDVAVMVFAIEAQGDGCRIDGNIIDLTAQVYGGIRVTGLHNDVTGNRIVSTVTGTSATGPIGIWTGSVDPNATGQGDHANLCDNHLTGVQFAAVVQRSRRVQIAGNTIAARDRQGLGVWVNDGIETLIADNHIRDVAAPLTLSGGDRNRAVGNVISAGAVGILASGENALEISGNLVEDVTDFGIGVFGLDGSHRFACNRVAHCAYRATNVAVGVGILHLGANVDVVVESCEVVNTGVSPDHQEVAAVRAIGIGAGVIASCQIANNRVVYEGNSNLDVNLEHRALWLVGPLSFRAATGAAIIEFAQGGALISGNVFQGPGNTRLVELQRIQFTDNIDLRFEKVTFSNNRCEHITQRGDAAATVLLFGSHLIVMGNHVKAPRDVAAMHLGNRPRVALLGNYSTGPFAAVNTTVPTPHTDYNVQII